MNVLQNNIVSYQITDKIEIVIEGFSTNLSDIFRDYKNWMIRILVKKKRAHRVTVSH